MHPVGWAEVRGPTRGVESASLGLAALGANLQRAVHHRVHQLPITPPSFLVMSTVVERGRLLPSLAG